MQEYKKEIDRVIREGVEKGLDAKSIVDQILALMTEVRKGERISVQDFEKLLKESKEQIEQARKHLVRGLTGTATA